ncbi:MAG: hypothetical protein JEZ08_16815 [Clostridiales bacterium]|nr:hypothetical protein [Clostridiales bacterium]
MIINKEEYKNTLSLISSFTESRDLLQKKEWNFITDLELQGVKSTLSELKHEVEVFEKILKHEISAHHLDTLHDFHKTIIINIIQQDVSNEEMASMLDISEDEYILLLNNNFYGISKVKFLIICQNLSIKVDESVYAFSNIEEFETEFLNLKKLNITPKLLQSIFGFKLNDVRKLVQSSLNEGLYVSSILFDKLRTIVGDFSDKESFSYNRSLSVAFKKPINIKEQNLNFTTAYAGYVAASLMDRIDIPIIECEPNPIVIRNLIIEEYGSVSLESCLRFVWSLGIPVVPLNISSGFHGACFKLEERICITLNQQTNTTSRWKFDLLHELYHALTMKDNAYIEVDDIMHSEDEEEERASMFAHYVVFGTEVESYLRLAVEKSDENVAYLKRAVEEVSNEYNLNLNDFSNYVAYRLQQQKLSWWGVAKVLQTETDDPREISLSVLQDYMETGDLNDLLSNLLF